MRVDMIREVLVHSWLDSTAEMQGLRADQSIHDQVAVCVIDAKYLGHFLYPDSLPRDQKLRIRE